MTKWEYLAIGGDWAASGYKPRYLNGWEQKGWADGPNMWEYMNQLGEAGWELVGVSVNPVGTFNKEAWYFKRPRP
jgi:hypothetical protein